MTEQTEHCGIGVKLIEPFAIIKETLERMGIQNRHDKKTWPSCYIYEAKENGVAYIAHFKELLRNPNMTDDDQRRRNTILWLLSKWDMIEIMDEEIEESVFKNIQERKIDILSKAQIAEEQWEIIPKVHKNTLYYHINVGCTNEILDN